MAHHWKRIFCTSRINFTLQQSSGIFCINVHGVCEVTVKMKILHRWIKQCPDSCCHILVKVILILKGHWITSASFPDFLFFFSKKLRFFIPLEVYAYIVTASLILLATSTHLQRYMHFSFRSHFLKSKMAAAVMAVEFGTTTIILVWRKICEACLCSSFDKYKN